jgi:hypothetical protein
MAHIGLGWLGKSFGSYFKTAAIVCINDEGTENNNISNENSLFGLFGIIVWAKG